MRNNFKIFKLENHDNKTYGLRSLSPELLPTLEKVINHYAQLPLTYPYNNGKSTVDYLKKLSKVAPNGDKYKYFKLKQEISEHKRLRALQDWYEHQAASLDDKRFWRKLATQRDADCRKELQILKQQWQRLSSFATYSSFALYLAAQLLSSMESYLQAAQFEFNLQENKLPRDFRQSYSSYLFNFTRQLQQEKQVLENAMLSRLQLAASQHDITYDDVIITIIHQLQKINVIDDFEMSKPRRSLTPFLAHEFQKYLNKSSRISIKQASHQLPWIVNNRGIVQTCLIYNKNHVFLIPKQFANDVPQTPRKIPRWLMKYFPGHDTRFQLFQTADCQNLLKILNNLPKLHAVSIADLTRLDQLPLLQQLHFCHQFIQSELRRIQDHRYSRLSYVLQKRTLRVIKKYRFFLQELGKEIARKLNEFIAVVLQTLDEAILPKLHENSILQIETLLNQTESIAQVYQCSHTLIQQIQTNQHHVRRLFLSKSSVKPKKEALNHTSLLRISQHIQRLFKGRPIGISKTKQIITTYREITNALKMNKLLNDSQTLIKFQVENLIKVIPMTLQQLLHQNPLHMNSTLWNHHILKLFSSTHLWQEFCLQRKTTFKFQTLLRRYLFKYLNQLLQLNLRKNFQQQRIRFTAICSYIREFGDYNLKNHFETLMDIVNKPTINWRLFRILAETIVQVLQPNLDQCLNQSQSLFFQAHTAQKNTLPQVTQQPSQLNY